MAWSCANHCWLVLRESKGVSMDFRQDKLSGFTTTHPDGSQDITDFTTSPWTRECYDAEGTLTGSFYVSLDEDKNTVLTPIKGD